MVLRISRISVPVELWSRRGEGSEIDSSRYFWVKFRSSRASRSLVCKVVLEGCAG